jgi:hypothetical protein
MHLHEARLCLDCETLHMLDRCPHCASDAFAFLTQWLPINERRGPRPRRPAPVATSSRHMGRWLTALLGVGVVAAARRWRRRVRDAVTEDARPRHH